MANEEEASKLTRDLLEDLIIFQNAMATLEEDDREFDRLINEAKNLPPLPATSQEDLFKQLSKKDAIP